MQVDKIRATLSLAVGVVATAIFMGPASPSAFAERGETAEKTEVEHYPSGEVRERHVYRDGKLAHSTWFRPDGTVLDKTDFAKQPAGWYYLLREDGSIRVMWQVDIRNTCGGDPMVDGLAIFMNPAQTESLVLHYEEGNVIEKERYAQALELIAGEP